MKEQQNNFPSTLQYASCPQNIWKCFSVCKLSKSKRAAPLHKGKLLIGISESKFALDDYKYVILGFLWGCWYLLICGI